MRQLGDYAVEMPPVVRTEFNNDCSDQYVKPYAKAVLRDLPQQYKVRDTYTNVGKDSTLEQIGFFCAYNAMDALSSIGYSENLIATQYMANRFVAFAAAANVINDPHSETAATPYARLCELAPHWHARLVADMHQWCTPSLLTWADMIDPDPHTNAAKLDVYKLASPGDWPWDVVQQLMKGKPL